MMTPQSVRNFSGHRRLAAATAALTLLAAAPVAAVQGDTLESAIALVHDGRYAEARPALAALAKAHPRDDRIAGYLGRAFFGLERYGDAITWFEKAIALKPDSSDHHMWLGHAALEEVQQANILRKMSLASKARRALERAVELNPANVEARGFLFAFYRQAPGVAGGSRSRARAQADEIVKLDPVRGHLARAALYEDDKDVTGAEREYLAAIAADASRAGGYLSLGQLHVRAGDYDKAFAVYDRGLNAVPGNPPFSIRSAGPQRSQGGESRTAIARCGNTSRGPPTSTGCRPRTGGWECSTSTGRVRRWRARSTRRRCVSIPDGKRPGRRCAACHDERSRASAGRHRWAGPADQPSFLRMKHFR